MIESDLKEDQFTARDANKVMSVKPLVYLACPYSHEDRAVRVARFDAVNRAASKLMREGLHIFSPISHTHPIAEAGGLPCGWDFWHAYDRAVLSVSNKLIVLMLGGWRESVGVNAEIQIAVEMNIPIEYMGHAEQEQLNG